MTAYASHSYTSSRGSCSKLQLNGITTSFAVLQQLIFLLGVLRFFTSSLIQQVITEYNYYIYLVQEYFSLYRYTGTVDYLQPFDDVDLQFTMHHTPYPDPPLSLEFLEAAEILMLENNLEFPHTLKKLLLFILIFMICFM